MLHSVALQNSLLQGAVDAKSLFGPKSHLMHRKKSLLTVSIFPSKARAKEKFKAGSY